MNILLLPPPRYGRAAICPRATLYSPILFGIGENDWKEILSQLKISEARRENLREKFSKAAWILALRAQTSLKTLWILALAAIVLYIDRVHT
jgi:hypothetical protein